MADSKEIFGRITGVKVFSADTKTWSGWKTSSSDIYKEYTLPQIWASQGMKAQLLYRVEYDSEDWEARRLAFYGNASFEYYGSAQTSVDLDFVNTFDDNDFTDGSTEVIIANTQDVDPVKAGETKQIQFYGVLSSTRYFTGKRTAYFRVHADNGSNQYYKSTFQAVKSSAISVPPQLTISALPTSVTAGDSVIINAQNRSDLILHYRFTANNQTLHSGDASSDDYQVNTNVSWFNTAGLTSDSMDVEVTASDDYSRTASVQFRLSRPKPLSVTPVAPKSTTKNGAESTTFSWSVSGTDGTQDYVELQYSYDNANWSDLGSVSGSGTTLTKNGGFFAAGTVYWRVRVRSTYGLWSSYSNASYTVKYDKATVTLTSPTSGSIDIATAIKFAWTIAEGSGTVDGTQMETSVDNGATWVNRLNSSGSSTSYSAAAGTFPAGKVLWRVRANDSYAGWSDWKQANFTVTTKTPVVTLISPTSGSREGGNYIEFAWEIESGSGSINGVQMQTSSDDGISWTTRLDVTTNRTNYISNPARLPPGSLKWRVRAKDSYTGWGDWKQASVTIVYSATSYVEQVNSPTGGNINAANSQTFGATLRTNGTPYTPFTIASATFYWRSRVTDSYNSASMTPSGSNATVTIAGGTFPAGVLYWYIEATDNTGRTTETDVYTVSTLASDIDAQPVAPVNTVEISNDDIVFMWRYASTSGEPQNGAELQYSTDGAIWTQFAEAEGTVTSVVTPPDTFYAGTVFWRVRAFNSSGTAGPWSTPAQFVAYGAPAAPTVTVDAVPFAVVRWQASGQASFEVDVDGKIYGPYLGTDKAYALYDYLRDGMHTAKVRILGEFGIWSQWGQTQFQIANVSVKTLYVSASTNVDTELAWNDGSGNFYIYRDDKLIGRTNKKNFTDRTALGTCDYRVIERLPNGNYNASAMITRTMEVNFTHIAALSGGEWVEILHTLKSQSDPVYSVDAEIELSHMDGTDLPSVSVGPYQDESGEFSAVFLYTEQDEHKRFRALFRKPVIVKTRDGEVFIGFLNAWERKPRTSRCRKYYTAYTFTLQRIYWEDFIDDTE